MKRSLYGTRSPGSLQPVVAGLVTALVGFSASFALVDVGLRAVGADPRQAVDALFVLCLAVGALNIGYAVITRKPIGVAWSTPGAALLASAGPQHGGYPAAVGAFVVTGLLILATGLSRRLVGWIGRIPGPIASALLAGVLWPLCLAPVRAEVRSPALTTAPILVWLVLSRIARRWAAPGALAAVLAELAIHHHPVGAAGAGLMPHLSFTVPRFTAETLIGIALPLFVITMAAQNLPGQAVLRGFGFHTDLRPALLGTGAVTAAGAPLGMFAVCLAAISAALAAGPDAHRDPSRRWIATVSAGTCYILLGLSAALAATLLAAGPPSLIETVAGLALLGTLGSALSQAFSAERHREAAAITFAVSASGISVLSIGAAFWGLVCGLAIHLVLHRREHPRPGRLDDPSAEEDGAPSSSPPVTPLSPAPRSAL